MSQEKERRVCSRSLFFTGVTLRVTDMNIEIEADLLDISISGMYVRAGQLLPAGAFCTIVIKITGKHSTLLLEDIQGQVVRQDTEGLAIHFASPLEWFVVFKIYTHYGR